MAAGTRNMERNDEYEVDWCERKVWKQRKKETWQGKGRFRDKKGMGEEGRVRSELL